MFGKFFIDGKWTAPSVDRTIPVIEAATERCLGELAEAGPEDVDRAVAASRVAFPGWAATPATQRAELMEHLAEALVRRADAVSALVSRQNGMPIAASRTANVDAFERIVRYYAGLARAGFADEERLALSYPGTVRIQREPVGVVAVIVPWNYPLGLAAMKIAPALAAGCTIVLKPAPETSLDAAYLMAAVEEAGIPAGVVNLVTGGPATGDALVRHPGIDKVSFTGSTTVGRIIGGICGARLKPVTLELGGKSAAVVLDDADLAIVMQGLTSLSFANAGQSCFLNSRVLASRKRYDDVVAGLIEVARSFVLGDPLDPATTMGPLVSARQRERVEGHIAAGIAEGARVVAGGGRPSGLERGWFVEPTVFAGVDNVMTVAREEIFGPVVCVLPYDTEEDAVAIANDSEYGLAGSVWSGDTGHALRVARQIQTGSIGLNMWRLDPGSPFGGWKSSGVGKELGPEGLDAYLNTKSIFEPC